MTQITLGDGIGTYDFTGSPPSSLYVASPGLSGIAYFGSDVGSYQLGPVSPTLIGPLAAGNFPASFDQSFAFMGPAGSAAAGNFHGTLVKDDSPNPDIIGTLTIGSSSGNVGVSFPAGSTANVALVLDFVHPSPFLSAISGTTETTWTAISAGEILPQTGVISEPGTLALFGVALVATWWSRRGLSAFTGRREVI